MTTFNFPIDKTKAIRITIPDLPEKFTYYYEPTEKLHEFDEATVTFASENNSLEINQDILNEIVASWHIKLKKLITNSLQAPVNISPGTMGVAYNNMLHRSEKNSLSSYWLWSSKKIATLMYNSNNQIYIEIFQVYPWNFVDPSPEDQYISFDEFMKQYKHYAFEAISKETALEWYKQCEKILAMIGIKTDSE